MNNKIKASIVSYLNTQPFLYGIYQHKLENIVDISLDIPADCAKKLSNKEVDIGLIPVGALAKIPNARIISDYCIAAEKRVTTVCVFSDIPIHQIEYLYLDYQSRTSVLLAQILLKEYWKIDPVLLPTQKGFENNIKGTTAGLVIGDRAMELLEKHFYIYDLSEIWYEHTKLPFVFAVWASIVPIPKAVEEKLNRAFRYGIDQIDALLLGIKESPKFFNLKKYYTKYIDYELDETKRASISTFLAKSDELSKK